MSKIGEVIVWMEKDTLDKVFKGDLLVNANIFGRDPNTTSYPFHRAIKVKLDIEEIN